jgi:hypothetical protein
MSLWPGSAAGSNMSGQPPSITRMPCSRPQAAADPEKLPRSKARCIHTCLMPRSAHSCMVASAVSGRVAITTASTPPGIDFKSWKHLSPSTWSALGLNLPNPRSARHVPFVTAAACDAAAR